MFRSKIVPVALATVIAAGGASAVLAASESRGEDSERQEITAAMSAKTSVAQAIAAAEKETGGKAVGAEFEDHNGVMTYTVKVSSGGKLQKVLVDPETGKVTKTMAANQDDREDNDRDED